VPRDSQPQPSDGDPLGVESSVAVGGHRLTLLGGLNLDRGDLCGYELTDELAVRAVREHVELDREPPASNETARGSPCPRTSADTASSRAESDRSSASSASTRRHVSVSRAAWTRASGTGSTSDATLRNSPRRASPGSAGPSARKRWVSSVIAPPRFRDSDRRPAGHDAAAPGSAGASARLPRPAFRGRPRPPRSLVRCPRTKSVAGPDVGIGREPGPPRPSPGCEAPLRSSRTEAYESSASHESLAAVAAGRLGPCERQSRPQTGGEVPVEDGLLCDIPTEQSA
jgi:hypothetical protein